MDENDLTRGLVYSLFISAYERYLEIQIQADAAEWSAYTANLALAQQAMEAGNYPEARQRLAECPEGKRGWEWEFLNQKAQSLLIAVPPTRGWWNRATLYDNGVLSLHKDEYVRDPASGEYGQVLDTYVEWRLMQTGELLPPNKHTPGRVVAACTSGEVWKEWLAGLALKEHPAFARLSRYAGPDDLRYETYGQLFGKVPAGSSVFILFDVHADILNIHDSVSGMLLGQLSRSTYGYYFQDADFTVQDDMLVVHSTISDAGGGADPKVTLVPLKHAVEPDRAMVYRPQSRLIQLRAAATIGAKASEPDAMDITLESRTRRLVADNRTIRVIDTNIEREVAALRLDAAIAGLQVSEDGTRLIVYSEYDARVWDIRDPEERRKDLQAEWAERVPAGAYLDTLWNSGTPTDALLDAIIADQSLTPLRRLVAAEMLDERQQDARWEADRAFKELTEGQTDKTAILAAARAAEMHPRVRELLVAMAEDWEYRPPEVSAEERLEEAEKGRRSAEADQIIAEAEPDRDGSRRNQIRQALVTLIELRGINDPTVALALSKWGRWAYWYGLDFSEEDWPMARQIAEAAFHNASASDITRAHAYAGAGAIAVDAGEFEEAALWFSRLSSLPPSAKPFGVYLSAQMNEPNGVWGGEVSYDAVSRRAIAMHRRELSRLDPETFSSRDAFARYLQHQLDWLSSIPSYRDN